MPSKEHLGKLVEEGVNEVSKSQNRPPNLNRSWPRFLQPDRDASAINFDWENPVVFPKKASDVLAGIGSTAASSS